MDVKLLLDRSVTHGSQICELYNLVNLAATKTELHVATSSISKSLARPNTSIELDRNKNKGIISDVFSPSPVMPTNGSYRRPTSG
jgi:hypothetical protein